MIGSQRDRSVYRSPGIAFATALITDRQSADICHCVSSHMSKFQYNYHSRDAIDGVYRVSNTPESESSKKTINGTTRKPAIRDLVAD